ncbi:3213_t:CDS:2, partial [Cetraspora pellucida]
DKITKKYYKVNVNKSNSTFEQCKTVFKPHTSISSIAAHLLSQLKIESIIQKQIENSSPLSKKKQNSIVYQLVTWIIKAMLSLDSHWLLEDFKIYQALITIEMFAYLHTGDQIEDFLKKVLSEWEIFSKLNTVVTDNALSMKKVIRQLGVTHLGCTAHTINLVVTDSLKKSEHLVEHAKSLNNFLVNCNKYRSRFYKIQKEIIKKRETINLINQPTCILDPISSDTATR